uniref:Myosin n=1 Tax=Mizuhopecten yessoensis TaxID=6573 RepID=Q9BLD4_MIZYE|nr:myosin [Mizuhopecten yessoensis]
MADEDVDDLSQLGNLDNATIKRTLQSRYAKDKIYTYCGDILIAVNPFKDLPIFGKKQHEEYHWKTLQRMPPPHVFNMAARAYRRIHETRTNQVILLEGNSGAGKTESTKYMVKHLVSLCPKETGDLHERIVKINPLLEAFGNAKTTMNDNSSRFAKYLEMSFATNGQVTGAIVRDYLLEKSRVVDQMDKEGNFHIFYCLFAGAPVTVLKNLHLKDARTYRIVKGNEELLTRTEFYRAMYQEQIEVLKSINLEQEDIDIIHTILAAILLITQVEFLEPDDPNEPMKIKDTTFVENVADLLNVSYEDLGHALIATKQTYVGETLVKRKSMYQAIDSRDAFAKALYERIFGWIVRQINLNLHPSKFKAPTGSTSIGILDIAGFERLEINSMEQMCINLINERLQSFTNRNVMDYEMSIYKEEGIHVTGIKFKNNDALLDLFMKKTFGLLPLLDEESKLGQGSNERFVKKLNDKYDTHPCFTESPHGRVEFGVRHFAAQVWYDGSLFIEKNRDMLSQDVTSCMRESDNPFVSDLFTVKKGPTGTISATMQNIRRSRKAEGRGPRKPITARGQLLMADLGRSLKERYGESVQSTNQVYNPKDHKTVISYFQSSMNELLQKLQRADPYYVRCIKPNMFLKPDNFDDEKVLEQMLYNGISEVAKIRKLGLPIRKRYDDFTKRYRPLFLDCRKARSDRAGAELLLKKTLPDKMMSGIQFGKTRVFMQEDVSIWLEKCRGFRERAAVDTIAKRWQQYKIENKRKEELSEGAIGQSRGRAASEKNFAR